MLEGPHFKVCDREWVVCDAALLATFLTLGKDLEISSNEASSLHHLTASGPILGLLQPQMRCWSQSEILKWISYRLIWMPGFLVCGTVHPSTLRVFLSGSLVPAQLPRCFLRKILANRLKL